jgi:hypothetical protein
VIRGLRICATLRAMKPVIQGTCLCQAVELGVTRLPRQVTQCNCSVCRRYGTLWAYYPRSAVSIAPRDALEDYSVRPRGLKFVRCRTCGCVICWDSRRTGRDQRMGVNMRMFDHALMADVPVKVLDGDKTWRVLGNYVKPEMWIAPSRERARAAKPRGARRPRRAG